MEKEKMVMMMMVLKMANDTGVIPSEKTEKN